MQSFLQALRHRHMICPYIKESSNKRIIIPWGQNRLYPPKGCIHKFEHALVGGRTDV